MGMRITTNMMMNSYRFDLMNATNTLAGSRDKVITQRKFNSYSEDPTTATHAWRIRRAYAKNESYKINNSDTGARFNIAWETLGSKGFCRARPHRLDRVRPPAPGKGAQQHR